MKTAAKISILAIGYLILAALCLVLLAFLPAARDIDPDGTLHFRPWIMMPVIIIPGLLLLFLYYLQLPRGSGDPISFPILIDRWCQSSLMVSPGITMAGISLRIRKERQSETSYRILAILSVLFFFPLVPVFCIMAARCQDAQSTLFRLSAQLQAAHQASVPDTSIPPTNPHPKGTPAIPTSEETPTFSQQNEVAAVPFYRQKSFWAVAAVALLMFILFSPSPEDPHAPSVPSTTVTRSELSKTGITFYPRKVRNDVTGDWRLSTMSKPIAIHDFALDYYNDYFQDDETVHFIINYTLDTTTKIIHLGDLLDVCVYEYVDGEEHDAETLGSGMFYMEYHIYISTGETELIQSG